MRRAVRRRHENGISTGFVEIPCRGRWKVCGNQETGRDHDRISCVRLRSVGVSSVEFVLSC
jgi:hypothetical protein